MITACKEYITDNGRNDIWNIDYHDFQEKCQNCIRLSAEYQTRFINIKEKIEQSEDERQFDFSETYIFGKINSFIRRIEKIMELFNVLRTWKSLASSHIEGIEMMNTKLQFLITTMKKKPYDFLDYRKSDFDIDYDEFKSSIADLEVKRFLN